jgi:ATP-dependent DNA helicase RecG
MRGPGDFLGVKQSGLPEFRLADLARDQHILEVAREDAKSFISSEEWKSHTAIVTQINSGIDSLLD